MLVLARNFLAVRGRRIVFHSPDSHPRSDSDAAPILDESKCALLKLIVQFL